jgi:sugar phosphate isomerase/epimerase
MTEPETSSGNPQQRRDAARQAARREAFRLARDAGAVTVTQPMFPGETRPTVRDVEPLPGARAARDLELAARRTAREYIRQAREAGHSWDQIGRAIGAAPNADADQAGLTVAEAAYTYAAGNPNTDTAIRYGRSFVWRCRSCDQAISDRGLIGGPADDEAGHGEGCPRLAAAVAEWDAGWEAEP